MDKNRIWLIGSVLLMIVAVVLGYTMGISPKLDEASSAKETRLGVEAQNEIYELQLAQLKKQFENIDELQAELDDLRQEVPADARFPDLIKQLEKAASKHNVTVTIISVSDPQLYVPIPADEAAAPASDTADGAEGEAPADAADATAPVAPAPLPAAVDAENFVAVPISLAVAGKYQNVLNFMESVQKGKRLFLVNTFSSTAEKQPAAVAVGEDGENTTAEVSADAPGAPTGTVAGTITGYVYVLLNNSAAPETVTAE